MVQATYMIMTVLSLLWRSSDVAIAEESYLSIYSIKKLLVSEGKFWQLAAIFNPVAEVILISDLYNFYF